MSMIAKRMRRAVGLDERSIGNRYANLVDSGPITVTTGQVVRGLRIKGQSGTAITVPSGVHDVLIEDCEIGPMNLSGTADVGINIGGGTYGITVRHCTIHGVASGLYANTAQHPIVFEANYVYDILGPMPRGQMVQFDKVNGGTGQSKIIRNISDADARTQTTHYEDHISMYESSGTAATPILIACNRIRGGDSQSGSAMMIGDYGNTTAAAGHYYDVRYNIVVGVPNTGIGVPAGGDMTFVGNWVCNRMPTRSEPHTEGGFYVTKATNVKYDSNRAISHGWSSSNGALHYSMWDDGTNTNVTYTNNNWQDETLTDAIFNAPHPMCPLSTAPGNGQSTPSLPSAFSAYALDEGSGLTANDASGGGHALTLQSGTTSWVTHDSGKAVRTVNGGPGMIGPACPISSAITLMAWCKVDVLSGYQALFELSGAPIQISVTDGARISVLADFGNRTYFLSRATLATGTWYHIAVTISASEMALYIDGALDTSQSVTLTTPFILAGVDTKICGSDGQLAADLTMDNVRIFASVLSAANIQQLMSMNVA